MSVFSPAFFPEAVLQHRAGQYPPPASVTAWIRQGRELPAHGTLTLVIRLEDLGARGEEDALLSAIEAAAMGPAPLLTVVQVPLSPELAGMSEFIRRLREMLPPAALRIEFDLCPSSSTPPLYVVGGVPVYPLEEVAAGYRALIEAPDVTREPPPGRQMLRLLVIRPLAWVLMRCLPVVMDGVNFLARRSLLRSE